MFLICNDAGINERRLISPNKCVRGRILDATRRNGSRLH